MVCCLLVWLWACGALHYRLGLAPALATFVFLALLGAALRWPKFRPWAIVTGLVVVLWMAWLLAFSTRPDSQRQWWAGSRRPAVVRVDEAAGKVSIDNVRHFKWQSRKRANASYVFQTYYLDRLDSLDLIVVPWRGSRWFAHTMLSFGFGPERRVVISVEARRERGEKFSVLAGAYKQLDLYYQISSERDALTFRALDPDAQLVVYPVKASPEFIRGLFVDLARRAQTLLDAPEFYRPFGGETCATELFDHLGSKGVALFPARAGALLHALGRMDTGLDFRAAGERFSLAHKVREFAEHPEFSKKIRE